LRCDLLRFDASADTKSGSVSNKLYIAQQWRTTRNLQKDYP